MIFRTTEYKITTVIYINWELSVVMIFQIYFHILVEYYETFSLTSTAEWSRKLNYKWF
jgi:hypothetical protein